MIGTKFLFTISALLVVSAVVTTAEECASDVSEAFIATIDNSTYFNTCAEGTTFNITSALDVLNFTDADLLTFCGSSTCLEPIHELMGSLDCNITYEGMQRDLSTEVSELHDLCHEVLEEAEGSGHAMSMDMSMDMGDHTDGSGDSAASVSSSASHVVLTVGSVVSALAIFLA